MFRRALRAGEGVLLVERRPSRSATSIHMFFVPFPSAVIWLDADFRVVDKVVAQPWRPFYAPGVPAQYTLEAEPPLIDAVEAGDQLVFRDAENRR